MSGELESTLTAVYKRLEIKGDVGNQGRHREARFCALVDAGLCLCGYDRLLDKQ